MIPSPSKDPTPSEYAVLTVMASGGLILLGLIGLGYSLLAPPEKVRVAEAMAYLSFWSLGIGLFIAICYRWVRSWDE